MNLGKYDRPIKIVMVLIILGVAVYAGVQISQRLSEPNLAPKNSSASQTQDLIQQSEFDAINCGQNKTPNITVTGEYNGKTISITTTSRLAGAIDSLKYDNIEFVNSYDHGRQIQTAVYPNNYGGCYNPTEAGNKFDDVGQNSSSLFLNGCSVNQSKLYTKNKMAFWLRPGETDATCRNASQAVNTTVLSEYVNEKIVEIGYNGLPNVIRYENQITIPETIISNDTESVTGYIKRSFNQFYKYDLSTRAVVRFTNADSDPVQPPWNFMKSFYGIPILSNGTYAIAAYSPGSQVNQLRGSDLNPNIPDAPTSVWTNMYFIGPRGPGVINYESFIIVGTLAQVTSTIPQLLAMVPPPPIAPRGYVATNNCSIISGWVCRQDAPNESIRVKFYVDGQKGSGTYIGDTVANLQHSELVASFCGGSSMHGFRFTVPENIKNGIDRNVYAYGVNSVNQNEEFIFGGPSRINCLSTTPSPTNISTPTPTPTPTPTITPSITTTITTTPTITPTPTLPPGTVACGLIDINGDDKLTLVDLAAFSKIYGKTCGDTQTPTGCGLNDTNGDGSIGIIDLASFAKRYNQASCSS